MNNKFKIIDELEFIVDKILKDDEVIYLMFSIKNVEELNHYYFLCDKKGEYEVYHVSLDKEFKFGIDDKIDKDSVKKLFLTGGFSRLKSLISYAFNYDVIRDGEIECNKTKKPKFYCFIPGIDKFYSFNETCKNVAYNGFYDFINYLLIYSNIENKYFTRSDKDKSIFDSAIVLDDEITLFMNKNQTGRSFSFEHKINDEWKRTGYSEKCNDLCSMMDNYNLIAIICFTDYVFDVGNAINKLKPESFDWETIRIDKNERLRALYKLTNNKDFILKRNLSVTIIKEILDRLDIDHQIDMVLKCMTNEEIYELSNETKNWNVKLDLMKYIDSSK